MTTTADVEAEFDRFVAAIIPVARMGSVGVVRLGRAGAEVRDRRSRRRRSTSALVLLDEEGARALTVRRLAADLKISTRTLYKRIISRDNLIRNVVELHFSTLELDFDDCGSWESMVWNWCARLHGSLCAHPHLTDLMTDDDVVALGDYVDTLLETSIRAGLSPTVAAKCCQSLTSVTINDALGGCAQRTVQVARCVQT